MNAIPGMAKEAVNQVVSFLNQPLVKEGVKNIAGSITLIAGCAWTVNEIEGIVTGRDFFSGVNANEPRWVQVVEKVALVFANFSIILSAGASRHGNFLVSKLTGCFFSEQQLTKAFGPNTIYALNPYHPRHVASIAAVVLALPMLTLSTCRGLGGRVNGNPTEEQKNSLLTTMLFFNTITSRPVLHLANQLGRFILTRT
ncbi:MAG: hypothetical protein H0V82_10505 [Candidatus Protochlamydia sp.]|nr:hypothetical protein [Candidatus Protochlamydia sp.]